MEQIIKIAEENDIFLSELDIEYLSDTIYSLASDSEILNAIENYLTE
jgi:hypothetical protein